MPKNFHFRAWAGDATAAIHVANIVGVAPPDYYEDENKVSVTAVPKVRTLNNNFSLYEFRENYLRE